MLIFTNTVTTGGGISFFFPVINIYYELKVVAFRKYISQAFCLTTKLKNQMGNF